MQFSSIAYSINTYIKYSDSNRSNTFNLWNIIPMGENTPLTPEKS